MNSLLKEVGALPVSPAWLLCQLLPAQPPLTITLQRTGRDGHFPLLFKHGVGKPLIIWQGSLQLWQITREKISASFFFVKWKVIDYGSILRDMMKEYRSRSATCRAQIWNKLPRTLLSVTFCAGLHLPAAGTCLLCSLCGCHCREQLPSCNCVPNKNSLGHYWIPVPLFQQKLLNYFLQRQEQLCLSFPPCWMQHSHLQTLWAGPWKKQIPLMDWTLLRTPAVKGEELPHNEQGFGKPRGCSL